MATRPKDVNEVELARGWVQWLVDTRQGYLDALLALPRKERLKDRWGNKDRFVEERTTFTGQA